MTGIHPDFISSGRNWLLGTQFVFLLQEAPGFREAEEISVYFEFIFATVVWNRDDVPDSMAALTKQLGDKFDVDLMLHADTSVRRMPVVAGESVSEMRGRWLFRV
jgi:hypothetical protein